MQSTRLPLFYFGKLSARLTAGAVNCGAKIGGEYHPSRYLAFHDLANLVRNVWLANPPGTIFLNWVFLCEIFPVNGSVARQISPH
jgi:hypothetical protein